VYRTASGDGGEGEWRVVAIGSYVDNGGTILTGGSFAALRKFNGNIHVKWFGAIPLPTNSVGTPAGEEVQAAIDAAALAGVAGVDLGEGWYRTEDNLEASGVNINGLGKHRSHLKRASGGSNFDHVLRLDDASIFGVDIDGTALTDCCVTISRGAEHVLTDCYVQNGVRDGVYLEGTAESAPNNNGFKISDTLIVSCGKTYSTGTVSGTSGTSSVTVTGAADLTTLGYNVLLDFVYFPTETGTLKIHEINTITSNTITFYPPLASTLTATTYALKGGAGVQITPSGDNLCYIENTIIQNTQGPGVECHALYGSKSREVVHENNLCGQWWGARSRPSTVGTVSPSADNCYFESATSGVSVVSAYAQYQPTLKNRNENVVVDGYSGAIRPLMEPERGSWTPTDGSGASLTFAAASGYYVRQGRFCTVFGFVTYPATASGAQAIISGLPLTSTGDDPSGGAVPYRQTAGPAMTWRVDKGLTRILAYTIPGDVAVTNANLTGATLEFCITYRLWLDIT
jgi:hypothetical protein